ncbi:polysaccharide deacetylase family protein [Actinoplanes sp. NPDC051470]|uniref:polysaccharide deacetylase family protein n=1 Tax=Actinoplanes sp. NPDC051470 TaxID=3157224 RepID=UPI0034457FEE
MTRRMAEQISTGALRSYVHMVAWAATLLALASCGGAGTPPAARGIPPASAVPSPTVVAPSAASSAPPSPPVTSPKPRPEPVTAGLAGSRLTTGSAMVALTFDDGPDPRVTPQLLDLLRTHHVSATFCLVGERVKLYPRLTARIAAEGHTLCNHSWDHAEYLYKRGDAQMARDLERTSAEIHRAVPGVPIRYFRAPYGNFTPGLIHVASRLNMIPLGWSVDDQCYLSDRYGTGRAMVRHMTARVRRETKAGAVILSHDLDKPQTLVAYRQLLPWLRKRFEMAALPPDPPPA